MVHSSQQFSDDKLRLLIVWRALRFTAQKIDFDNYKDIAVDSLIKAHQNLETLSSEEVNQIYTDVNESITLSERLKCSQNNSYNKP